MMERQLPECWRVERCRVCGSSTLEEFLDLGVMPLANAFVEPDRARAEERRFPLEAVRCADCGLVQLSVVVRPDVLFRHYLYSSSSSPPLLSHFEALAAEVAARFAPPESLVVEIGSNDGVLLRPLVARGIWVVGVEPASNLARLANQSGLETWNEFFGASVAARVARERGRAKAVLASNVLAHIDDLGDVLEGLRELLDEDGVFIAEVPYLVDLLEHLEYDTIYHEHLSYFHLAPLARLFAGGGLELFDVRHLEIHGGSIRIFVGRRGRHPVNEALREALRREGESCLDAPAVYTRFAERVGESRAALRQLLERLRQEGRRVAGLGATAKGNTLLNYCGIGPELIPFIADSTPLKHGLLTPGMHIPIRPEGAILEEHPDFTLLLAWNYADSILRRFAGYVAAGGRFIHPVPLARVLPS